MVRLALSMGVGIDRRVVDECVNPCGYGRVVRPNSPQLPRQGAIIYLATGLKRDVAGQLGLRLVCSSRPSLVCDSEDGTGITSVVLDSQISVIIALCHTLMNKILIQHDGYR